MVQANSRPGYPAGHPGLCVAGFSGPGIRSKLRSLLVRVGDELCSTFVMAAKRKRTDLSLSDKIKVFDMLDTMSQTDIAKKLNISQSQVSRIAKNKHDILKKWQLNDNPDRKRQPYAIKQVRLFMPSAIGVSPSLDFFRRHLKTHYFASP